MAITTMSQAAWDGFLAALSVWGSIVPSSASPNVTNISLATTVLGVLTITETISQAVINSTSSTSMVITVSVAGIPTQRTIQSSTIAALTGPSFQ